MDVPLSTVLPLASAALAVVLHHLVFKRYDFEKYALQLFILGATSYICLCFSPIASIDSRLASITTASFYTALTASILTYRAFFHPLHTFPGPFAARLTKWWGAHKTLSSRFHYFLRVHYGLHQKYGDYVRTGPRELSIFDPDAIQAILGYNTKTTKGPYYDVLELSLLMNRDKAFHRQRRRIWDNGMKESLSDFAPRVEEQTSELLARIARTEGPIPLNEFCLHYSYDVTSSLAFGRPMGFNVGQSSEIARHIIEYMTDSLRTLGLLWHVPWFLIATEKIISSFGPMKAWADWTREQLAARKALKDPRPDMMMHLLNATPDTPAGNELLFGEARLIIAAGSETTANALTFIFLYLALYPEYQDKLHKELEANAAEFSCMRPQPLLDAIIQETMRCWPSVYFTSQRVTPPEGILIPSSPHPTFVPGNTIVAIAGYAMGRDERNFLQPEDWIPERWTTKPELCIRKETFIPFLTGPYTCAGRNLAMMELRSVVARVVKDLEVKLPEGFDQARFFESIEDHWVVGVPKVRMNFEKRR